MVIRTVMRKMDSETLRLLEESIVSQMLPSADQLSDFLLKRYKLLEATNSS